jgi:hypothetical protein
MSVQPGESKFLQTTTHSYAHKHTHTHNSMNMRMHTHRCSQWQPKRGAGFATRYVVAGHVLTCSEYDYLELATSSHVSWWNCSRKVGVAGDQCMGCGVTYNA